MTTTDELRSVYDDIKSRVDALTRDIAEAFHQKSIDSAKTLLVKFKYFDNVLEKLKERIPPL